MHFKRRNRGGLDGPTGVPKPLAEDLSPAENRYLMEILKKLVIAPPDEIRRLLQEEANFLVHPYAEGTLRQTVGQVASNGDHAGAERISELADMLANCRSLGVDAALAGAMREPSKDELLRDVGAVHEDPRRQNDPRLLDREIRLCQQLLAVDEVDSDRELWLLGHDLIGRAAYRLGEIQGEPDLFTYAADAFDAMIARYGPSLSVDQYACTRTFCAAALLNCGNLTRNAAMLQCSASHFIAVQEAWKALGDGVQWATATSNVCNCLYMLGDVTGDYSALEAAEADLQEAIHFLLADGDKDRWAACQHVLGLLFQASGERTGDVGKFIAASNALRLSLAEVDRERDLLRWATGHSDLGNILLEVGQRGCDKTTIVEAIAEFRRAIEARAQANAWIEWARGQLNLGNALASLGRIESDQALQWEAVEAYRAALQIVADPQFEALRAAILVGLGEVLEFMGDATGDRSIWAQSEAAYREALAVRTRAGDSWASAGTEGRLAAVLFSQGRANADLSALQEAVGHFRASLEAQSDIATPSQTAGTAANLAMALQEIGQLRGDPAFLEDAAAIYAQLGDALTKEQAPLQWADSKNNLACILIGLEKMQGGAHYLEDAEAALRSALEVRREEFSNIARAEILHNLGLVLHARWQNSLRKDLLDEAVECFTMALTGRTRYAAPAAWGDTMYSLANSLRSHGQIGGGLASFLHSHTLLRDLLEFYAGTPAKLAAVEFALANTLSALGWATGDRHHFEAATDRYRSALTNFEVTGHEDICQDATRHFADALLRLDEIEEAAAVVERALARSDAAIMDAGRSAAGVARAVHQVGALYGLLSACHLRKGDPRAAVVMAEAGRERHSEFARDIVA